MCIRFQGAWWASVVPQVPVSRSSPVQCLPCWCGQPPPCLSSHYMCLHAAAKTKAHGGPPKPANTWCKDHLPRFRCMNLRLCDYMRGLRSLKNGSLRKILLHVFALTEGVVRQRAGRRRKRTITENCLNLFLLGTEPVSPPLV